VAPLVWVSVPVSASVFSLSSMFLSPS
jgi:hypothetical protein